MSKLHATRRELMVLFVEDAKTCGFEVSFEARKNRDEFVYQFANDLFKLWLKGRERTI